MARRDAARRSARGGDVVQAPRPTRPRLITAAAALALCAALALDPLGASRLLAVPAALGSMLALASLVLASEQLLPWALAVLGGEYAGSLFVHGGPGTDSAPLVGAALLLLGELVAWSTQLRTHMREEPAVLVLRLGTIAGAVVLSLAVGAMLVALAATDVGGGLAWTAVGTAAAVGAVLLATRR